MRKYFGLLLLVVALSGCASNYDFAATKSSDGRYDTLQMIDDLKKHRATAPANEKELYDFSYIPLIHTRLRVIAEVDDKTKPDKHIFTEIDSCLPFFGFMNAKVERFDKDKFRFESYEFRSRFWGLCTKLTERTPTPIGLREKTQSSFLWLFRWSTSPKFVPIENKTERKESASNKQNGLATR